MNKRAAFTALLVLGAGLLAYAATHLLLPKPAPKLHTAGQKLDWLAREFELTPAQISAISALQTAYAAVCEGHCVAIAAAEKALANAPDEPSRSAARAELARIEQICADATREHLRAIAAHMHPAQAARFLALMEPRVHRPSDRSGAPALDSAP